jgi:hypothetical protein
MDKSTGREPERFLLGHRPLVLSVVFAEDMNNNETCAFIGFAEVR